MSEAAIQTRDLGKQWEARAARERALAGRLLPGMSPARPRRSLWAVRHVGLSLQRGDCLGVIGPNGAGKSTLLMLLAGLLEPTEGEVEVRGRVNPFLKVGAGLFSDLDVLSSIRLAGVLLGLERRQVAERLDAIVAFGGLSDYLDARLGELSSGYQARVVFAAALHSDIDVLLIDEVFAVGDASFQKRCVAKMDELRGRGKTIVLASHDLELVARFCPRAILLRSGAPPVEGPSARIVARYKETREEN